MTTETHAIRDATLGRHAAAVAGPTVDAIETNALIQRIVSRFHAAHRRELPDLIRLARDVERLHRHRRAPAGLADRLERLLGKLTMHMVKEEIVLFPRMRRGGGRPPVGPPMAALLAEHDDHAAELRALEILTQHFRPPGDACETWRTLYAGLAKFADDLAEHLALENDVLFPRFAAPGAFASLPTAEV